MKNKVNMALRKRLEAEKVTELQRKFIITHVYSEIFLEPHNSFKPYIKESNND